MRPTSTVFLALASAALWACEESPSAAPTRPAASARPSAPLPPPRPRAWFEGTWTADGKAQPLATSPSAAHVEAAPPLEPRPLTLSLEVDAQGEALGKLDGGFHGELSGALREAQLHLALHSADLSGVLVAHRAGPDFTGTLRFSRSDPREAWSVALRLVRAAPTAEPQP